MNNLGSTDRMAAIGGAATVVGSGVAAATYPGHWGVTWLAVLLGVGMLIIIFLPQMSPTTKLPGKKGSLMLAVGGVAAVLMAFVLLTTFSFTFTFFDLASLMFLVGAAGALLMGWSGWQAFQAEGGKFNVGMSGSAPSAAAPAPPAAPAPAAPAYTPPSAPPSAPPASDEPGAGEERGG